MKMNYKILQRNLMMIMNKPQAKTNKIHHNRKQITMKRNYKIIQRNLMLALNKP